MKATVLDSYLSVPKADWDALVGDGSPFLEWAFLAGLEELDCAVEATGWVPRPILVTTDAGAVVGGAPGWVKTHSMGEFVYDHGWADAAHRAGIPYFPKLIIGVPFTPVTGARLLVHPDADPEAVRSALLRGIEEASSGCHGVHVLFDTQGEADWLDAHGAFPRLQFQFHWHNQGYEDFEGWLKTFPSKKRNKIRRERRDLAGIEIIATRSPSPELLDGMHAFYRNTCRQFGPWGRIYLSQELFQHLGRVWGDRLHLVTATRDGTMVAGAFNVIKGERLYGRYWGATDDVKFLHFEVCYYRAIEECIRLGLKVFEPGHGGGHKYRRGFRPTLTRSSHFLHHRGLHDALAGYSEDEAEHVRERLAALKARTPTA